MRCSGQRLLSTWLHSRVDLGVPTNINARISHLAESKSAGLEYARAAAGAAAGEHLIAEELLRCEISEGQSLERYQHRTHPRLQSAVELSIVGINGQRGARRNIES